MGLGLGLGESLGGSSGTSYSPLSVPPTLSPLLNVIPVLWGWGDCSLGIHGDTQEPEGQGHKPVTRERKPRAWGSRATSSCLPGHQGSDPWTPRPGGLRSTPEQASLDGRAV